MDIEKIKSDHLLWSQSNGEKGVRANLSRANLTRANLSGANLSRANLSRANLTGAVGNMEEVKSIHIDRYVIVYTIDMLWIGCQGHLISEWKKFSDDEKKSMDGIVGFRWGEKWLDWIFQTIEISPAVDWRKSA